MNENIKGIVCISFLCLMMMLCGCHDGRTTSLEQGDTIEMKYADYLRIVRFDDRTHVDIVNPWDTTKLLHSYDITQPFTRAAVFSSVHISLIDELGHFSDISAVSDLDYINNNKVRAGVCDGTVVDVGSSMSPDIERLIDANPDAILVSPFENSGGYGAMEKLGIPIIECADYMETSPLGRAEWVKLYGLLFGCFDASCEMFDSIDASYNCLKSVSKEFSDKSKSVVFDLITGSTWYVPGASSTVGVVLKDAGGTYAFADRNESGSLQLSPETVFDKCHGADVWIMKYTAATDKTYAELAKDNPMYQQMQAYKNRSVYACNLHHSRFFEETPFHPDRLLRDFIKILHPEALPGYTLEYYKPMTE